MRPCQHQQVARISRHVPSKRQRPRSTVRRERVVRIHAGRIVLEVLIQHSFMRRIIQLDHAQNTGERLTGGDGRSRCIIRGSQSQRAGQRIDEISSNVIDDAKLGCGRGCCSHRRQLRYEYNMQMRKVETYMKLRWRSSHY